MPAEKQPEFLHSVESLPCGCEAGPVRQRTFRDANDSNLVCWVGTWPTRSDVEAFVQSKQFRALKGAVAVLGELIELEVEAAQPWPDSTGSHDGPSTR